MSGDAAFRPLEAVFQGTTWCRAIALTPAIHIDETRTVRGESIAGGHLRQSTGAWVKLGKERYAHRSQHLNPHARPPPLQTPTRHDPSWQPHFFKTLDHDWDLWDKHRDLIFENKGLRPVAATWDKVLALAEDLWTFRFTIQNPGGNDFSRQCPMSHPTPTIMYGSWCAGCAPTLVALCATLFIPARMVQVFDHALAEVWIDGRWCLADNSTTMWKGTNEMMSRASLAEILLNPLDPARHFTDEQRGKFWEKTAMMYHPNEGLWHEEPRRALLSPQNALALYPGWAEPRFKSADPHTYALADGRPQHAHPALILRQGQAFQRRFWLGSLRDTWGLTATFAGVAKDAAAAMPGVVTHHVPAEGGDWFIAVNGVRHPVREQGGWQFLRQDGGPEGWPLLPSCWAHTVDVPLGELRENAWNTVGIGCPGSGDQFLYFGGFADFIEPVEPCFCPRWGRDVAGAGVGG